MDGPLKRNMSVSGIFFPSFNASKSFELICVNRIMIRGGFSHCSVVPTVSQLYLNKYLFI
jgi:hypothetical protein